MRRLAAPVPVSGGIVIVAALIGIAVNAYVMFVLSGHGKNLNNRAAFLHVTGDIGASIGVVIAGAVILLTGWLPIDPLLSLAIAALIAVGAWRIVRAAVNLLMEGTAPARTATRTRSSSWATSSPARPRAAWSAEPGRWPRRTSSPVPGSSGRARRGCGPACTACQTRSGRCPGRS